MNEPPEQARARELVGPTDTLPQDPAEDVASPEFPVAMRGYERAAVDAYVQRVVRLVEQLDAVRSPRSAVRVALERVGEETSGILAQAHATAESVTSSARREAEELTTRTRREAEELTARTRREAEERLERARTEAEETARGAQERAVALDRDADLIWNERGRLLEDVLRLSGELQRVVRSAEERFPPEAEAALAPPQDADLTAEIPGDGEPPE